MKVAERAMIKHILVALAWVVGLFALIQLIPCGRTHKNPAAIKEPVWDSPRTRELAVRACFNCHSDQTVWPWYADVAPVSWFIEFDVEAARSVINFSEWNRSYDLALYSGQSIRTGNMPPIKYRMAHPEADLTEQELRDLASGLDAMLRQPGQR
jgi:mono/diheme cytochrome c family protein